MKSVFALDVGWLFLTFPTSTEDWFEHCAIRKLILPKYQCEIAHMYKSLRAKLFLPYPIQTVNLAMSHQSSAD